MRYAILASLVLLSGCSTAPFTPAPKIQLPSVVPISEGNNRIKLGNRAIADSTQRLTASLEETRAKLDGAIVAAHEERLDKGRLDQSLQDASASLDAAIKEGVALRQRVVDQDQIIDDQQKQIGDFKTAQETAQKKTDDQTQELTDSRKELAKLREFQKDMKKYWGLGAVGYGIARLGWHLLIILAILAAVSFALNALVPGVRPFFAMVVRFFKNLWPKRPPP